MDVRQQTHFYCSSTLAMKPLRIWPRLIALCLLPICLNGCGDREHGMRVSAKILEIFLSRIVLTGERKDSLTISQRPVMDCDDEFMPTHCLPVKMIDISRADTAHVATYRMVVGRGCAAIVERLLAFRENPRRISELYEKVSITKPKISEDTQETLRLLAWEENEQFNPDNEKKFVMGHYVRLVRDVKVDCGKGTVVLKLHPSK